MCGVGLLIACLMTLFQMGTGTVSGPARYEPVFRQFADAMPTSMFIVALLWAVVVGAGLFAAETDARLGEVWRTWPVPFWRFFAIKFTAGLLAVLLVLDGTTIVAGWGSPTWGDYFSMNWPYVACIVPLHATMFSVAVAWTCLSRRPVVAGMATVVTYILLTIGLGWSPLSRRFDPILVYENLARGRPHRPVDFTAHEYPVVIAAMGVILIASIMTAALALRRYDPKRQAD
jgi:ABC-type transport system involved in multi-copper enzyme maturation permease subunit